MLSYFQSLMSISDWSVAIEVEWEIGRCSLQFNDRDGAAIIGTRNDVRDIRCSSLERLAIVLIAVI